MCSYVVQHVKVGGVEELDLAGPVQLPSRAPRWVNPRVGAVRADEAKQDAAASPVAPPERDGGVAASNTSLVEHTAAAAARSAAAGSPRKADSLVQKREQARPPSWTRCPGTATIRS